MVSQPSAQTPPLEAGDRLTRPEFHRRYANMSSLKKAELIEGVVYMPAALRFKSHGQPHGRIMGWLSLYEATTPHVALGDNATVQLDLDNELQPDAVLLIQPEAGGQATISADDYIVGPPELVVEVAASSVSIDLYDKKRAYRRNGVREYLVWQVFDQTVSWFALESGDYQLLAADAQGIIRSRQFPGLWLAVDDLLAGRMLQVFSVLQRGLATAEHHPFVESLKTAANAKK
ncbi:Uma2 family endonuclease [Almyronema epifaneia]|uniref:Uma2 family endonuclease n=1 Tax=Almyronema epifaneia S1 TaxID=2991925 RepID=A0ABW6IIP9_9CYAN